MHNVAQVFSLSTGSEAVDETAEGGNARMDIVLHHSVDVSGISSNEQVGKGLAVVVVVVVEQELWRLGENLCLGCDFFADVEGMGVGGDLVAKKN